MQFSLPLGGACPIDLAADFNHTSSVLFSCAMVICCSPKPVPWPCYLQRVLFRALGVRILPRRRQQSLIPPHQKIERRGWALLGWAFGLGFIIGPVLGGIFSQGSMGLAGPAYISAILCGLNFLFALFFLQETRKEGVSGPSQAKKGIAVLSMQSFKRALAYDNLPRLLWLFFGVTLAFSMLEQSVALLIQEVWYPDATTIDGKTLAQAQEDLKGVAHKTMLILLAVGVTAAVVQGGLIGKLVKRFGEKKLIVTGTSVLVVGLVAFPLAAYTQLFLLPMLVTVLLAFGTGIVNPSLTSQLSLSVSDQEQGEFLGLGQSLSLPWAACLVHLRPGCFLKYTALPLFGVGASLNGHLCIGRYWPKENSNVFRCIGCFLQSFFDLYSLRCFCLSKLHFYRYDFPDGRSSMKSRIWLILLLFVGVYVAPQAASAQTRITRNFALDFTSA